MSSGTEGCLIYKSQRGVSQFQLRGTYQSDYSSTPEGARVVVVRGEWDLSEEILANRHHHKAWESKAAQTLTTLSTTFNSLTLKKNVQTRHV